MVNGGTAAGFWVHLNFLVIVLGPFLERRQRELFLERESRNEKSEKKFGFGGFIQSKKRHSFGA